MVEGIACIINKLMIIFWLKKLRKIIPYIEKITDPGVK